MNRKSLFLLLIALQSLLWSCNSQQKQSSENIKKDNIVIDSTANQSKDISFDEFLTKFSQDSAYQLANIKFPLKMSTLTDCEDGYCDTIIYLNKKDWNIRDFKHRDPEAEEVEQSISKTENGMAIIIRGKDCGILITYYFDKTNNGWQLVYLHDESM